MDKLDRIEQELNKQGVVLGKLEVNMDNIKENLEKHLEVEQCDSCKNNARLTVLETKDKIFSAAVYICGVAAAGFIVKLLWELGSKFFA